MSHFELIIGFQTDQGRVRAKNEDAINYSLPNDLNALTKEGALFVVADGVGGRSGGQEVSHFVAKNILDYFAESEPQKDIRARLQQSVERINAEVYNLPGEGATTLLMAYFYESTIYIAHVGDCSAFWLQNGVLNKLTQDHVMQLDPTNPLKQKLTRAIGHKATVEVDLIEQPLQRGGNLLMVSDGVTRYLSAATLAQMVGDAPPAQSVKQIIEAANQGGGADNSSVIVVRVGAVIKQKSPFPWVLLVAIITLFILVGAVFLALRSESNPQSATENIPETEEVIEKSTATLLPSPSPIPNSPVPTLVPTLDTILDAGDVVEFSESAPVLREIGQPVTAFIISPIRQYRIDDDFTTTDNQKWYALLDIRNEQRGWIREDELPPYTIVD